MALEVMQKLPDYLAQWITQQPPEQLERKIIWIRDKVIPWILSDSATISQFNTEDVTVTEYSSEE
jgi:hypothetical protein